jgi:hypothetical protein
VVRQDLWLFPDMYNAAPAVEEYAVKKNYLFITHLKNSEVIDRQLLPATVDFIEEDGAKSLYRWFEHLNSAFVPSALYSPEYYDKLAEKYGDSVIMAILRNIALHRGNQYKPLIQQWRDKYPDYEDQFVYVEKRL